MLFYNKNVLLASICFSMFPSLSGIIVVIYSPPLIHITKPSSCEIFSISVAEHLQPPSAWEQQVGKQYFILSQCRDIDHTCPWVQSHVFCLASVSHLLPGCVDPAAGKVQLTHTGYSIIDFICHSRRFTPGSIHLCHLIISLISLIS